MKHLKRNIVFAVLGMVFCSGLLCGGAWAFPNGISSDELEKISRFDCQKLDVATANKYALVYYKGTSTPVYTNENYDSSDECKKAKENYNAELSSTKNSGNGNNGGNGSNGDNGGDSGNNNTSINGSYEGKGTGEATILKRCDAVADGQGRIECLIDIVVNVFTAGVGILGVTGIIIVGIQYLTAGGDEAKMTKAKRRMYEIVIGLVLYMLGYALLKWLLPTYN